MFKSVVLLRDLLLLVARQSNFLPSCILSAVSSNVSSVPPISVSPMYHCITGVGLASLLTKHVILFVVPSIKVIGSSCGDREMFRINTKMSYNFTQVRHHFLILIIHLLRPIKY